MTDQTQNTTGMLDRSDVAAKMNQEPVNRAWKNADYDFEDARPSAPRSPLKQLFTREVNVLVEKSRDLSMHDLIDNASMIIKVLKPFVALEKRRAVLLRKHEAVERALSELSDKKYALINAAE